MSKRRKGLQDEYGFVKDNSAVDFHTSRRMFCIYKDKLVIAEPNLPYSHAEWFEKEGWISREDNSLMEEIVRGFVDKNGDIYFYTGYDFRIDSKTEEIFFEYLDELIERFGLDKNTCKIFGGSNRADYGDKWKPMKEYK